MFLPLLIKNIIVGNSMMDTSGVLLPFSHLQFLASQEFLELIQCTSIILANTLQSYSFAV